LQTDPAQALYIWLSIANFDDLNSEQVIGCPGHHSQAYTLWNVSAYVDEPGTEALPLRLFAGSFAGTTLALLAFQLQ
jgi:hypothetical protein